MGPFETPESCRRWQDEFELPFPVVPDANGDFFRQLTTGWGPCTLLVGPDGTVLFWETEFDEAGFASAIEQLCARLAPETVEGFDEMALSLYDPAGCGRIRAALETFTGGTVGVLIPSMPFKCPAAPYEAALLVEAYLRQKGVRSRTEIHLYTPEHQPMPIAGPELGDSLTSMLRARGIHYHPLDTFEALRPGTREVVSSDGRSEQVDLLIGVPPHQAPAILRSAGLLGVSGWIHVDPKTLRTEHDRVFAIGDVTSIKLPNGKMLPKQGCSPIRRQT